MECQMRVNDVFCAVSMSGTNHRFVVDCYKPNVVPTSLLPTPAAAIFSMAYSSCAERIISHAKCMSALGMLSCTGLLSCAWLCGGVQCRKTCRFITNFLAECTFHQKGQKIEDVHAGFGSSVLHATIPRKKKPCQCKPHTLKMGCQVLSVSVSMAQAEAPGGPKSLLLSEGLHSEKVWGFGSHNCCCAEYRRSLASK